MLVPELHLVRHWLAQILQVWPTGLQWLVWWLAIAGGPLYIAVPCYTVNAPKHKQLPIDGLRRLGLLLQKRSMVPLSVVDGWSFMQCCRFLKCKRTKAWQTHHQKWQPCKGLFVWVWWPSGTSGRLETIVVWVLVRCPVADPGFLRGGANPWGGASLLFGQFFPKTAWKLRSFGPEGGGARPLDPPLWSLVQGPRFCWTSRTCYKLEAQVPDTCISWHYSQYKNFCLRKLLLTILFTGQGIGCCERWLCFCGGLTMEIYGVVFFSNVYSYNWNLLCEVFISRMYSVSENCIVLSSKGPLMWVCCWNS